MSRMRLTLLCLASSFALCLAVGCGRSTPPTAGQATVSETGGEPVDPLTSTPVFERPLPAASIASPGKHESPDDAEEPEQGSPEWLIREIARLRVQSAPDTDDPARLRGHRRWRNERIIERAQEAITLTHADPAREELFDSAVGHLMEARLQLALQAEPEQSDVKQRHVEELYQDADALYRRAPESRSAAEAAYVRARFANLSADRFAATEPRWLEEFSRQARLFAGSFPRERERAVGLLDAAGRSCELNRLRDEAVNCYSLLEEKFPKTPQGRQATAALRRLRLEGERLDSFGGPTLDGGYSRIDDFRGRVVIIAFWASHSRQCVEQFPRLSLLAGKGDESRVALLGVSLDTDKKAAEKFIGPDKSGATTILWPDANRRGWNNPIAQHYGVRDIPTYWLVDAEGVVVNSLLSLDELEQQISRLLDRN